jgi:hypothetical protein
VKNRVAGKYLVDCFGQLLHEGNMTRIIIKDDVGKTLLEIPVTIGVAGVVVVLWLAVLSIVAALVTNCRFEVERRE